MPLGSLVLAVFMATIQEEVWMPANLPAFESMQEAKQVGRKLEGGRWKWSTNGPGDGKRFARFDCNAHKDCERKMRVKMVEGIGFEVELKGKHSDEANQYARANSTLTFDEQARLREGMDSGSKPAGVLKSMTKVKIHELRGQGEDPLDHKRPEGGLEGVCC